MGALRLYLPRPETRDWSKIKTAIGKDREARFEDR
jgi:hypothetical protein